MALHSQGKAELSKAENAGRELGLRRERDEIEMDRMRSLLEDKDKERGRERERERGLHSSLLLPPPTLLPTPKERER